MLSILNGNATGGTLRLDSASATLALTPDQWTLSQVNIKKTGLFEIEGQLSCNKEAKLIADLKLGISGKFPTALGQPSSEEQTSVPLRWTPLHVETTPDQLWQRGRRSVNPRYSGSRHSSVLQTRIPGKSQSNRGNADQRPQPINE